MFTISNGIILKGQDLQPVRENIVVDDGKIIEIGKEAKEGKIIDVDGAVVCHHLLMVIFILAIQSLRMRVMVFP